MIRSLGSIDRPQLVSVWRLATSCMLAALLLTPGNSLLASTGVTVGSVGAQENREYVQAYATCAVRYQHDRAARAILSDLSIEVLEHRYADIFVHEPVAYVAGCRELAMRFRVAVIMSGEPLRYALAEKLVAADFNGDRTIDFADRAALTHRDPPTGEAKERMLNASSHASARERMQKEYEVQLGLAWLSHYGECVVRSDPVAARTWLLAAEGSAADTSAMRSLQPALGACLRAGDKLEFSKEVLRGTLAVNYFRLAHAPVLPSAGVKS